MLNFDILEKILGILLHLIWRMIFQEKCSSHYTLSTDEISLSDCLYFLKYWTLCVLQLFVSQVVTP